ncbi:MAG: 2-hydroxyglutaryl-CoA dehydratase [Deltaproteobacteria bacterium]|nr:2-hydroxyglutaryl-CoA dehydratase [Deltaproteobacteria bacterium]MBW1815855.1 2-hydroxyglutaryl-CoA dehydratase [Deltaproteobacteria bacterium]
MAYAAGLDIGSKSTKLVFLGQDGIAGHYVIPTGANSGKAGEQIMELGLADIQLVPDDIAFLVATGYGRHSVESAKKVSEISCQGKGIRSLFPEAEVIIDIGGQDFKVIKLKKEGTILSFAMNDKCAAGTGRYLELMAGIFDMNLDTFSEAGDTTSDGEEISSVCTVFAETEVINHISRGAEEKEIISGIFTAVSKRVYSLAQRFIGDATSVVFTGGVAMNIGVAKALERVSGCTILTPREPQITAALGAARIAREQISELSGVGRLENTHS